MCRPQYRDSQKNSVNGTWNVPTTLTSVGHVYSSPSLELWAEYSTGLELVAKRTGIATRHQRPPNKNVQNDGGRMMGKRASFLSASSCPPLFCQSDSYSDRCCDADLNTFPHQSVVRGHKKKNPYL